MDVIHLLKKKSGKQKFSGRGISDREKTLWCSWIIQSDDDNLFFKTDKHSCALKAAKAKTWFASNRLFHACMD